MRPFSLIAFTAALLGFNPASVFGLPFNNSQSPAVLQKVEWGQGCPLRLPSILKRGHGDDDYVHDDENEDYVGENDDAAAAAPTQTPCDRVCIYRLLYQAAFTAVSSGIEYGMVTHKSQDFCFKEDADRCPQLVESEMTAIASRSSYLSMDYDACDSACLLTALNEVSRKGALYGMQFAEQLFAGDDTGADPDEVDKLHWTMWILSQPASSVNADALKAAPVEEQKPWNTTKLNSTSTILGNNATTIAKNSTANGTASTELNSSHPATNLLTPYITGSSCNDPYLCEDDNRKYISELLRSAEWTINGTTWLGFMLVRGKDSGSKPTFPSWTKTNSGIQRPPPDWNPDRIPEPPADPNAPDNLAQPVKPDTEPPHQGPPEPSEEEKYNQERQRRQKEQREDAEKCKLSSDKDQCIREAQRDRYEERKTELQRESERQLEIEEKQRLDQDQKAAEEKCKDSKDKTTCVSDEKKQREKDREEDERHDDEERKRAQRERKEEEERMQRERKAMNDKCNSFQDKEKCLFDEQRKMDDQRRVEEERKVDWERKKQDEAKVKEECVQSLDIKKCEREGREKKEQGRKAQDEKNRLADEQRAKAQEDEIRNKCEHDKDCIEREKANEEARQKDDENERKAQQEREQREKERPKSCLKKPCEPFPELSGPSRFKPPIEPGSRFQSSLYDPADGRMRAGDLIFNPHGAGERFEDGPKGPPKARGERIEDMMKLEFDRFKVLKGGKPTGRYEYHRREDLVQMDDQDWVRGGDHSFRLKNGRVATNALGDPLVGGPYGSPPQEARPIPRKKAHFSTDYASITEYEAFDDEGKPVKFKDKDSFSFRHHAAAKDQLDWAKIVDGRDALDEVGDNLDALHRYNGGQPYDPPKRDKPGRLGDDRYAPFEPKRVDSKNWPPPHYDGPSDIEVLDEEDVRKLKRGELGKLPKASKIPKGFKGMQGITKVGRFAVREATAPLLAAGPIGWIVLFGAAGASEFMMFSQAKGDADVWWHCAKERLNIAGVHTCGMVDENGNEVMGEDQGPFLNFVENFFGFMLPSDIDGDGKMEDPFTKFVAGMQDLGEAVYDFFDSSEDGTGPIENTFTFIKDGVKTTVNIVKKGWGYVKEKVKGGWKKTKKWFHKTFTGDDD